MLRTPFGQDKKSSACVSRILCLVRGARKKHTHAHTLFFRKPGRGVYQNQVKKSLGGKKKSFSRSVQKSRRSGLFFSLAFLFIGVGLMLSFLRSSLTCFVFWFVLLQLAFSGFLTAAILFLVYTTITYHASLPKTA